ncbi:MAG TPA: hypothetical protein VK150_05200, partial [Geothrix sp.]|nr:hypothetical protein [Geothrix sp.]
MAVRAVRWGWSRARWQRLALALLWLGQGVWVFLGPNPGRHWTRLAEVVSRPSQSLAARWDGWRANRRISARDMAEIRAENARLAAELAQMK